RSGDGGKVALTNIDAFAKGEQRQEHGVGKGMCKVPGNKAKAPLLEGFTFIIGGGHMNSKKTAPSGDGCLATIGHRCARAVTIIVGGALFAVAAIAHAAAPRTTCDMAGIGSATLFADGAPVTILSAAPAV